MNREGNNTAVELTPVLLVFYPHNECSLHSKENNETK